MSENISTTLVVLLLVVCGALLYLDWQRKGEIDFLAEQLNKLNGTHIVPPPPPTEEPA